MRSSILLFGLTLSSIVLAQSNPDDLPNYKKSHPSKKFSRSTISSKKLHHPHHNAHHATVPVGDQFSKRGPNSASEAGGLQSSLAFLICVLSDEAMAASMEMGLTAASSSSCSDLLPKSPANNGPILTAVGGADEVFTSTLDISSSTAATTLSIAASLPTDSSSANTTATTTTTGSNTLADSDGLVGTQGDINTNTYIAPTIFASATEDAIASPSATVKSPVTTAVSGMIKIQMIGDSNVYYYPKNLESPATSDTSLAATFTINTPSGKCLDSSSPGLNGIAPRFDLSSRDYAGVASQVTYLGGTLEAKDSFEVMDGAPLSPLGYNSDIPFVIAQPHNHFATRTLETTLWSFQDCSSSTPYITATWNSVTMGSQDLLICANADSMNTRAPSDFFLSYKPGSSCGLEFNVTVPATKVQVNFTFVPTSDGSAFYP